MSHNSHQDYLTHMLREQARLRGELEAGAQQLQQLAQEVGYGAVEKHLVPVISKTHVPDGALKLLESSLATATWHGPEIESKPRSIHRDNA